MREISTVEERQKQHRARKDWLIRISAHIYTAEKMFFAYGWDDEETQVALENIRKIAQESAQL